MEWYDFGVFGYLAGSLALNFFPKGDPSAALLNTFLVFGVGLVFRPLGGIIIGRMGDTRGRKPALILTILMMAAGTVIIGLIPTYATIGMAAPAIAAACAPAAGVFHRWGVGWRHRLHGGMVRPQAARLLYQLPADVGGWRQPAGCRSLGAADLDPRH